MECFSSSAASSHAENYSADRWLNESLFRWRSSMEFPVSIETLILMPVEYYTKELGNYKDRGREGGTYSNGRTCPQEAGALMPPGGEAARKVSERLSVPPTMPLFQCRTASYWRSVIIYGGDIEDFN